jgi:hypothetical protein
MTAQVSAAGKHFVFRETDTETRQDREERNEAKRIKFGSKLGTSKSSI